MDGSIKTIGVLTSGGDAPGMNAAVRAVTRTALYHGMNVKGIIKGYEGLLGGIIRNLHLRDVSGILEEGGTFLGSARCHEFNTTEGVQKAKKACQRAGIDGLVVLGGDGTFRGAKDLSTPVADKDGKPGIAIPCIAIPCTIDNDIGCTDYCIGFDTAVNTVVNNIDKLRDTSESHDRCSVVEVMGRYCGDIALHAAINCGAVSVLIPEIPFDIEKDIFAKMKKTQGAGKNHFIVIVAEGVTDKKNKNGLHMDAFELAKLIEGKTGVESRATVIGHVQRGGSPSARDRIVASEMGHYAVGLLMDKKTNRVVVRHQSTIMDYDIVEALKMPKRINENLVTVANEISI